MSFYYYPTNTVVYTSNSTNGYDDRRINQYASSVTPSGNPEFLAQQLRNQSRYALPVQSQAHIRITGYYNPNVQW